MEITGRLAWARERRHSSTGPVQSGHATTGPVQVGQTVPHGPTAALRIDGLCPRLVSRRENPIDRDPIEQYGADPLE